MYTLPLASDDDSNLDSEEVRILWDFVHGDIMDSNTRRRLVEHWGMCERHAWAYASWVRTLAWFHGWRFPLRMLGGQ